MAGWSRSRGSRSSCTARAARPAERRRAPALQSPVQPRRARRGRRLGCGHGGRRGHRRRRTRGRARDRWTSRSPGRPSRSCSPPTRSWSGCAAGSFASTTLRGRRERRSATCWPTPPARRPTIRSSCPRPAGSRIYSNIGFDSLAAALEAAAGRPFADLLREWVLDPLGMAGTRLVGRPSSGIVGPAEDLAAFGRELLRPRVLPPEMLAAATTVAFPGLRGVLPGVGRLDPNDWGLGFELRDGKDPHWTGAPELALDLRALRENRHVPVGGPSRRPGARMSHRSRVRAMGPRGVAGAVGCRATCGFRRPRAARRRRSGRMTEPRTIEGRAAVSRARATSPRSPARP